MATRTQRFEDLIVWREARKLNKLLFNEFKNCKTFFFRDQILRASLSISSNIAEGFERKSDKEFIRFLYIARGSCGEVRSQIYLGMDSNLLSNECAEEIISKCNRVSFLIYNLISAVSKSQ
jgi:four helix bundle protein